MALEVKPKGFLAMHSYLPWSATPRSWMERVPSWLMWNLPLSVIWMPSCCTIKRQKLCQSTESFPPAQPSACSANPGMAVMSKCGHQMLALLFQRNQREVQGRLFLIEPTGRRFLLSSFPWPSPGHPHTDTPHRHPTQTGWLEPIPCPDALTEVSWHRMKFSVLGQPETDGFLPALICRSQLLLALTASLKPSLSAWLVAEVTSGFTFLFSCFLTSFCCPATT